MEIFNKGSNTFADYITQQGPMDATHAYRYAMVTARLNQSTFIEIHSGGV